jgi:hypothetical protein
MIGNFADRISGAQLMFGFFAIFAGALAWRERKDSDRFVLLLIGLGLGCAIGHLATL